MWPQPLFFGIWPKMLYTWTTSFAKCTTGVQQNSAVFGCVPPYNDIGFFFPLSPYKGMSFNELQASLCVSY